MRIPENTGDTSVMFRRRTTCRLIVIAVFLFAACAAQADIFTQPEEWRWLRFSTGSGLPSTEINTLCETPSGTVWVSTMAGPAWYNGFFWQHIDNTSGIPDSAASALFPFGRDSVIVLAQGRLYIGNNRGFGPLLRPEHNVSGPVLAAVRGGSGSVFFLGSDKGQPGQLYRYHRNKVVPVPMPGSIKLGHVPPERENYSLFHTRNNRVWLNTAEGLYRLDSTGWQLMYKHQSYSPVSAIIEDSSGNGFFFLATGPRQGFWKFRNDGRLSYTRIGNNFALLSADLAPDGEITAIYSNGVINRFYQGAWHLLTSGQMEMIGTTFIQYRTNGDLWLQNRTTLSLYRSSLQRWQYYNYGYDNSRNHINEILQARDSSVWVATGFGIHVHRKGKPVLSLTEINGTELGGVTALAEDTDGNIWIGSGSSFEGAFCWNGKIWRHVYKPDGLDAPRVHKIRRDRKGRLWFLSILPTSITEGNGAFLYENGRFTQWGTEQGLPNGRVYSFADDRTGTLWFGTLHGLSRWRNGTWTHWKLSPNWKDRMFALAIDSSDRVWFSRFSQGFGYVDGDSLRTVPIPAFNNGFNSSNLIVVDLRVDQSNRLWIATQGNGLYCYNNGNFSNIGVTLGLTSMNLWPILPVDDRVYIGTIGRGMSILSLDEQRHPPPVVVFEKPVVEELTAFIRWQPYAYWEHIPSDEIQTRYRLGNGEWSEWSSKHETFFHNLPSGTHQLVVEVKDMFASVNSQQYIASFEIPAPFYTHHWFLLPVGLLLTVTLLLAADAISRRRRYTAELQRINTELENRIRERTAALVMSNTHLRSEVEQRLQVEHELRLALSKEKELSELKTRFVGMVSHEFRTPLSAILASNDVLDRYYSRLTADERTKYYDRIRDSVARITALMDDVLFIGNAGAGKLAFIPMTLDPDAYCRDLLATLPQEQMQRVSYSFEGTTEVTLDSKLLRLILLNLLSNAFTYSSNSSSVDLSLRTTPTNLTIVVKDRGIGIPREDLDKVFDTFHRGTNIGTLPGSGLGLSIVKECVDLHRGTVTVQSSPEQGTEVRVVLPMAYQRMEIELA